MTDAGDQPSAPAAAANADADISPSVASVTIPVIPTLPVSTTEPPKGVEASGSGDFSSPRGEEPLSSRFRSPSDGGAPAGATFDSVEEAKVLADTIEKQARCMAESLEHVTGSLRSSLHAIGGMTTEYMRVYQGATATLAENLDSSIASMRTFVDRCRALNADLKKMRDLQAEIKGVKESVISLEDLATKLIKEKKAKKKP
eukprot:TRINITY_DN75171_c0_g1_i1.p1 TRINITY_DN75171_c0_g1~~TRINITY_DN75171_c0_g1_i1.p1  ORF type:complete len:201 (-),score=34.61 TRINITY_DN75171_c0_g1_i1:23-625(-)